MLTNPGRVPLGRRAWVGAGRHGATVVPDGTIDWYASGGIAADPDLWRLLDEAGPAVRVGPARDGSGARRHLPAATMRYRPGTGVLETTVDAGAGRRVELTDFAPWTGEGGVVRLVRALSGPVDIEVEVLAGPDRRPRGGARSVARTGSGLLMDGLVIAAPAPFESVPFERDVARWRSVRRLDAGEEMVVTIGCEQPLGVDAARRMLGDTELAWRSWLSRLAYAGLYRDTVERALIGIRSVTEPGRPPAGAGTTSLPRRPGSERASDDRWVRLRDAAQAVRTLAAAGLAEDAELIETWLRHSLTTAHLPWPTWLDGDGQPVPQAEEQPFEGWRRSQPVLRGRQPTVDIGLVGPLLDAVGASAQGPGGRPGDPGPLSAASDALAEASDWAADHWREPDAGRWEIERPLRLYTAGRIEVWSALTRMTRLARAANPLDLRAAGWQQESGDILTWLESESVTADGGLRMDGSPGAPDEVDSALLAVAWSGPWPAAHPVVATTVDRVLERLASGPLLYRYSDRVADERAGPDYPDLEASLLGVRALANLGRWDEAHDRFEGITALVGRAGAGLFGETVDPVSGQMYGNFPSTAAALALIDAALALELGPR